jgi:hypothetical protein
MQDAVLAERVHKASFSAGAWRVSNISKDTDSPVAIMLGPSRIVLPKHDVRILAMALMALTEEK